MSDFLQKLSTYNVFNFLVPGVLYALVVSETTTFNLIQQDLLTGIVLYYFIGLVISRIGSLVLGPFLRMVRWTIFADYGKYIDACKADPKILQLVEDANMYRTLSVVAICCLATIAYSNYASRCTFVVEHEAVLGIGLLLVLFLISYRKQTQFVTSRVVHNESTQTQKN